MTGRTNSFSPKLRVSEHGRLALTTTPSDGTNGSSDANLCPGFVYNAQHYLYARVGFFSFPRVDGLHQSCEASQQTRLIWL